MQALPYPGLYKRQSQLDCKQTKKLGWEDSNLRMPAPKAGALPLGYTPIPDVFKSLEDTTTRLTAQLPKIFWLAKCIVSADNAVEVESGRTESASITFEKGLVFRGVNFIFESSENCAGQILAEFAAQRKNRFPPGSIRHFAAWHADKIATTGSENLKIFYYQRFIDGNACKGHQFVFWSLDQLNTNVGDFHALSWWEDKDRSGLVLTGQNLMLPLSEF